MPVTTSRLMLVRIEPKRDQLRPNRSDWGLIIDPSLPVGAFREQILQKFCKNADVPLMLNPR
jgi:hypothetical protein